MIILIDLLGLNAKDLEWYQMLLRTLIVFIAANGFIRISGMRTFGTSSAFDVVVSITLGAIMGKCIMGHYPFFPGLLTGATLVVLHRFVAWLATRSKWFRKLVEGAPVLLFSDGVIRRDVQKKNNVTDKEITARLHENNLDNLDKVKTVWLETEGVISVVKKD